MKPVLHKFVCNPGDPASALTELNKFQDRVRLANNEKRTTLAAVPKASEPQDGELMFDGATLWLVVNGQYQQVQLSSTPVGVPKWFLEHLRIMEGLFRAAHIPEDEWKYYGG